MFIVLDILEYEKKRGKRKANKINRSPPVICHTARGLPFYLLTVCKDKQGIDWQKTAERCGRYASRIVAPRDVTLPDNGSLRRFIPSAFISSLVFNTAIKILSQAKLSPQDYILTLSDRKGALAAEICRLLPFSSQIRIITAQPEKYAVACAEAYDGYGASLILRSAYEKPAKPEVIINCDGTYTAGMATSAVITAKRSAMGRLQFNCSEISLSPAHRKIIPAGIEPVDFAGALSELCACKEYADSVFEKIEDNGCYDGAESLRIYIEEAFAKATNT